MSMLRPRLVWIMAIACGVAVANLYYNQPMLADMGRSVGASARNMGVVATLTQVGYGVGMLLFVPLGDLVDRRRLILWLLLAVSASLSAAGLAKGYLWLALASLSIGATTVAAQVLIPLASHLADPAQRGKVIGNLYTGLLLGILLARTVSGEVSAHLGWRAMFWLACGTSLVLAAMLARTLPHVPRTAEPDLTYAQLIRSLWRLVRTQPGLRESCLIGGALFGSFSAFWTTLVFLLGAPPYHYGSQVAGLFGLVGATGAMGAQAAGRLSDRIGTRAMIGLAAAVTVGAWVLFWPLGHFLWGLVLGVIVLDVGVQAAQVSNQTRVLGLVPGAQSRINTVYMIAYFTGGSLGSLLGAYAWSRWNWAGVCAAGLALSVLSLAVWARGILLKRRAEEHERIPATVVSHRCTAEMPMGAANGE